MLKPKQAVLGRAGNSLIGFLSESLVSDLLICSFLVSDLSKLLILLLFGEQSERFAHIAQQKRGNERIAPFLNKKMFIKHIKKSDFRFFCQKILSDPHQAWDPSTRAGNSLIRSSLILSLLICSSLISSFIIYHERP